MLATENLSSFTVPEMAQRWRLAALSPQATLHWGRSFLILLWIMSEGVVLGLVLAVPALMSLLVGPPWGMLADWLQSRGVLIAATILATLGSVPCGALPRLIVS